MELIKVSLLNIDPINTTINTICCWIFIFFIIILPVRFELVDGFRVEGTLYLLLVVIRHKYLARMSHWAQVYSHGSLARSNWLIGWWWLLLIVLRLLLDDVVVEPGSMKGLRCLGKHLLARAIKVGIPASSFALMVLLRWQGSWQRWLGMMVLLMTLMVLGRLWLMVRQLLLLIALPECLFVGTATSDNISLSLGSVIVLRLDGLTVMKQLWDWFIARPRRQHIALLSWLLLLVGDATPCTRSEN